MKTKKSTAFWAVYGFLGASVGILALVAPGDLAGAMPAILAALVGAAGLYQGANVADNYTRSKHYRPELAAEKENGGT